MHNTLVFACDLLDLLAYSFLCFYSEMGGGSSTVRLGDYSVDLRSFNFTADDKATIALRHAVTQVPGGARRSATDLLRFNAAQSAKVRQYRSTCTAGTMDSALSAVFTVKELRKIVLQYLPWSPDGFCASNEFQMDSYDDREILRNNYRGALLIPAPPQLFAADSSATTPPETKTGSSSSSSKSLLRQRIATLNSVFNPEGTLDRCAAALEAELHKQPELLQFTAGGSYGGEPVVLLLALDTGRERKRSVWFGVLRWDEESAAAADSVLTHYLCGPPNPRAPVLYRDLRCTVAKGRFEVAVHVSIARVLPDPPPWSQSVVFVRVPSPTPTAASATAAASAGPGASDSKDSPAQPRPEYRIIASEPVVPFRAAPVPCYVPPAPTRHHFPARLVVTSDTHPHPETTHSSPKPAFEGVTSYELRLDSGPQGDEGTLRLPALEPTASLV